MRLVSFSFAVALIIPSFAQGDKQALIAEVKALSAASTDAARDSINPLLKQELRKLLNAPTGLTLPMDDVPLSRVDAPGGKFRLITWNLARADGSHQYEGFLLSQNGRVTSLVELRDKTSSIPSAEAVELGPDRWYGALYYHVVPVKKGGKTWYTLLGWKGYSKVETRKVIEVLSFKGPVPTFGAMIFNEGTTRDVRKVFAYNFQNSMSLKWDAENKGIVFDHLTTEDPTFAGQAALTGPDLSFDAYVWYKGRWTFLRDVDARNMQMTKPSRRPSTAPVITPP